MKTSCFEPAPDGKEFGGGRARRNTRAFTGVQKNLIILIAFTSGLIRIPGSVYQNKL